MTEPTEHPQELLTSACRAQQRLARVLTSTIQPDTAEMYSIEHRDVQVAPRNSMACVTEAGGSILPSIAINILGGHSIN